jgi:hypothetical protein
MSSDGQGRNQRQNNTGADARSMSTRKRTMKKSPVSLSTQKFKLWVNKTFSAFSDVTVLGNLGTPPEIPLSAEVKGKNST